MTIAVIFITVKIWMRTMSLLVDERINCGSATKFNKNKFFIEHRNMKEF